MRSAVLRGEILTRLDQNGNKSTTYVPAERLLFATQETAYGGGPYVRWSQRDPLGITETGKGIYDPLGTYIPFQQHDDPRPPAGSYNSSSMSGVAASMANPFGSDTGCIMDGLPTSCSRVFQAINHNLAQEVIISGTQNPLAVLASHGVNFQTRIQHPSPDKDPELYDIDEVETVDYVSLGPGGQGSFETNPQDSSTIPVDINKIPELLNNPTCNDFVTNLIKKAAELNPNNPANSNNALDLFNAIKNGSGGYFLQPVVFNGKRYGGTIDGYIAKGDAKVYLEPQAWPGAVPNAVQIKMSQQDYALAGLHETIHHAGRFTYSDKQLAIAAHAVTGIEDNYPAEGETSSGAWSRYWNDILKDHCRPPRWSNNWDH